MKGCRFRLIWQRNSNRFGKTFSSSRVQLLSVFRSGEIKKPASVDVRQFFFTSIFFFAKWRCARKREVSKTIEHIESFMSQFHRVVWMVWVHPLNPEEEDRNVFSSNFFRSISACPIYLTISDKPAGYRGTAKRVEQFEGECALIVSYSRCDEREYRKRTQVFYLFFSLKT